jgi:hypothetical protein
MALDQKVSLMTSRTIVAAVLAAATVKSLGKLANGIDAFVAEFEPKMSVRQIGLGLALAMSGAGFYMLLSDRAALGTGRATDASTADPIADELSSLGTEVFYRVLAQVKKEAFREDEEPVRKD